MSLATLKGEGNGGIVRFKHRFRNQQSYLQRNVRRSLHCLVMGSTLSAFRTPSGVRSRDEVATPSDEEDEEEIRPAKRRRTSMFEDLAVASRGDGEFGARHPFGQVTNGRKRGRPRLSGKLQAVQPSDFYGKSHLADSAMVISKADHFKPKHTKTSIGDIVPKSPSDFKKALRLDITSIVQKFSAEDESITFAKGRSKPIDVKCRCSVAFFFGNNDDDPTAKITLADFKELFRKLSTCTLRTSVNDGGEVERNLVHLEPFFIPADEIYINRKKRNHRGQFVRSFEFAEQYLIIITLEPLWDQKEWPPFDQSSFTNPDNMDDASYVALNPVTSLLELGDVAKDDLYFFCKTSAVFEPGRQNKSVDLKLSHGSLRQKIPYALRLELKWSLPSHLSDLPTRDIKIETESPHAKLAAAPAFTETVAASPLARKGEDVSTPNSPADNRAHRRRSNVPTYNLKALSALQQGKSPRVRKSRDIRSRSAHGNSEDSDGTIVTYTFGKADSADLSVKRETTVTGLLCPFCGYDHGSLDDLRIHLYTNHSCFKFSLRRSSPPRIGFFVELAKQGLRTSPTPLSEQERTFQLSQPRSLFDLEKFLNGDESWVKVREGPNHNTWPEHLQARFHDSSLSSSPHESRHSSPNTSNDTDDVMDLENYLPKMSLRPRKKHWVPKTSKPLYDTITKQILQPGDEIPNSDEEKDEGWLHQKHRDIIMDYGDVTDDEKDYIIRWNPFIMSEQLTCETHLGDAVICFVEANRFWFCERKSRKREFGKTMETFMMRGVVDEKCMGRCVAILKEAENMEGSKEKEVEVERPVSPAKQRGALDCECGEHTQPPDRVICRGEKCKSRFFHRKCAEKSGRAIRGTWLCDHCVS